METSSTGKYSLLEFPMAWHLEELRSDGVKSLAETEARRKSLESATNLHWRLYATDLVICFEQFKIKNYVQALEALARCSDDIEGLKASDHPLYNYCPQALQHVMLSTKGFVLSAMPSLLEKGTALLDKCLLAFKENIKVTKFQSALIGIRSAVFMAYGVPGTRKAKEYVGEAIMLDNTVAEWHFLYGKCLGRLRRLFTYTDIPSDCEMEHHKKAVKLSQNKDAYYIVYLAQVQRETAYRIGRCEEVDVDLSEKSKQLFDESASNYRRAHSLALNCCHVLSRCALGFIKMPDPYNDPRLAHEIMERVVSLCPENPMMLHTWALIQERVLRDTNMALDFFEKAAKLNVFGAWMNLIRLTYLEHKEAYNPVKDLENLLDLFPEDHLQDGIFIQIASFYLFQRNHLFQALEFIMKVFNRDAMSQELTVHRSIFMGLGKPINFLQVVFDECRLKIKQPKTKEFLIKKCREAVILWSLIYSELTETEPKQLRKEILQESFLYTHPWARRRGRERHRRDVDKSSKKSSAKSTKSKSSTETQDKTQDVSDTKQKKEKEFKVYIPNPSTILKGWLTEEQQLTNHTYRERAKLNKTRAKGGNSPGSSVTRAQSTECEKEGKSGKWRVASISRDSPETDLRYRPAGRSYSRTREDSADSRGSSQGSDWRNNSRARDLSADIRPQRRSYTPRSYMADDERSLSRSSEARAASLNWRTECLSVEDVPKESQTDSKLSRSSQNPTSKWVRSTNKASSPASPSGGSAGGWDARNSSLSRPPVRRSSSPFTNWRSTSIGPWPTPSAGSEAARRVGFGSMDNVSSTSQQRAPIARDPPYLPGGRRRQY